ncbi:MULTISPECIES: methylase [Metallosphaera]|uniref:Methylase n=2 Tax=Metallosphaera TaxID=41980 RepID=A0A0K1SQ50_9CREN|nr:MULTISPECIES: methylase [Metallosphaera]AKV74472.1 methylase [Metallosphaera sedula]AKV76711.1 methylase [Metallosphaera sedula]AKV78962.1 methylase [Metallosphaera sedula]AKV81207.1 methylase [Metallosphaera sedula]AKV83447.1 methylase [Metallosphaera sedula]
MKLAILMDDKDDIAPLWRSISIVTVDGTVERVSASLGRSSALPYADLVVGRDMLRGEISLLSSVYPIVVNGDRIVRFDQIAGKFPELLPGGKTLGVGWCDESHVACLSGSMSGNVVNGLYPFPFREGVFDNVIVYEILDYDVIRESHRVVKRGGKLFLVFRDKVFGGVKPSEALKFLVKFNVISLALRDGFWIVESKKIR